MRTRKTETGRGFGGAEIEAVSAGNVGKKQSNTCGITILVIDHLRRRGLEVGERALLYTHARTQTVRRELVKREGTRGR